MILNKYNPPNTPEEIAAAKKGEYLKEYNRGMMQDPRRSLNDATPLEWDRAAKASDRQVGGNHYKDMKIQPLEFITANNLNFLEGNIIKYTLRHHVKGGAEDVRKVIHYAELLLETVYEERP